MARESWRRDVNERLLGVFVLMVDFWACLLTFRRWIGRLLGKWKSHVWNFHESQVFRPVMIVPREVL